MAPAPAAPGRRAPCRGRVTTDMADGPGPAHRATSHPGRASARQQAAEPFGVADAGPPARLLGPLADDRPEPLPRLAEL